MSKKDGGGMGTKFRWIGWKVLRNPGGKVGFEEERSYVQWGCMRSLKTIALCAALAAGMSAPAFGADSPAFDLVGPKVDVHVQRNGKTLPIGEVSSLEPGDRLWIHPDLPESQSVHFVLVVAFLRGSTDKPPADWFRRVETWGREVRQEGVFVVVPDEAQQALVFLAPETGGDFSTLRAAVQGRPGAFVRASQDLQQASWDRQRLEAYLGEVRAASAGDPKELKDRTAAAARSLGMRLDQQCFDKPTEQQAPCLVQHTEGLVLDDANAQTLITQLASGSTADMMNQISYSSLGGSGAFSPYVGAMVDLARVLSTFHTAKYQYIPALALPQKDTLNLRLNVPPSFRDPKSVIVVAMPPIFAKGGSAAHMPQMRAVDGAGSQCAQKPGLVLATEGNPLVFAAPLGHDLMLHLDTKAAEGGLEIPVTPEAALGGFVLQKPIPVLPEAEVTATLHGKWGFDDWEGPKFRLSSAQAGAWTVAQDDRNALIVGRDDQVRMDGASTVCVAGVDVQVGEQKAVPVGWKAAKADQLQVTVPLKEAQPGDVTLAVHQYGLDTPEEVTLRAYAEAAALERLTVSAGDKAAVLKGKRLDEVESANLAGIGLAPAGLKRVGDYDLLSLQVTGSTATLEPRTDYKAKIVLRDGRELRVPATVEAARPQVDLLSKGTQQAETDAPQPVRLGSPADLPLQGRLVFFLKSRVPALFPRNEKVELAAEDGSFSTTLSLADGSLMLEDAHTAVAVVDPLARFGASAFGPVQLRVVAADGVAGDWIPLGTLVRVPGFKDLRCPRNVAKGCTLTGTNLFLVSAVGMTADLANAQEVPPDFTGNTLTVPNAGHANGVGTLYLRLRDDPATVQLLTLPVTAMTPTAPLEAVPQPETPVAPAAPAAGSANGPVAGAVQPR